MWCDESACNFFADILEKIMPERWYFSCVVDSADSIWWTYKEAFEALGDPSVDCGYVGCAIGHALLAFPTLPHDDISQLEVGLYRVLGIPEEDGEALFGVRGVSPYSPNWPYWGKPYKSVTSQDVAAAIRRYVREGPFWNTEEE